MLFWVCVCQMIRAVDCDNLSSVDADNTLALVCGAEPMSDHVHGLGGRQSVDRLHQLVLRQVVESAGGLVEDDDFRIIVKRLWRLRYADARHQRAAHPRSPTRMA